MQYFKIVIMRHLENAFYFNRFNLKISETFIEFEYKTVSVNNAHSKWELLAEGAKFSNLCRGFRSMLP